MGFRFRKSIKLLPGLKINLTHKGISSAGIGKPCASLNIGKKAPEPALVFLAQAYPIQNTSPIRTELATKRILFRNNNRSIHQIPSNPNRMSGFG